MFYPRDKHLTFLLAIFSLSSFFFAHRFVALPCKIMVYLLSKGEGPEFYCFSYKERLNNRREMTVLCSSASFLYAGIPPLKCMKVSLVLVKHQQHPEIGRPLFSGTKKKKKSEVVSVFCHWRSPQLSLDSCGLPPTVLWGLLFLNKWVYDSDFLLPAPLFVINMEQHTPLGEGAEKLLPVPALHMCNLTGGGACLLHMKSLWPHPCLTGPGSLFKFSIRVIALF